MLASSVRGSGPPLLLLHGGLGLSQETVRGLAAELSEDFKVINYTQRGVTPSVSFGPYTVEQHVKDARRVLDFHGIERAWIAGHSVGGNLALHFARLQPHRVAGLIGVASLGAVGDGGLVEGSQELERRLVPAELERVAALEREMATARPAQRDYLFQDYLRTMYPAYFADRSHVPALEWNFVSARGNAKGNQSITRHLQAGTLEQALPAMHMPALFVHGEGDFLPFSSAADTAGKMPSASVVQVPGAGHFPWLEHPGSVRDAVRKWRASRAAP
jgi:proline iminopeptidase